jgi:hypothetical protein
MRQRGKNFSAIKNLEVGTFLAAISPLFSITSFASFQFLPDTSDMGYVRCFAQLSMKRLLLGWTG